MSNTRPQEFPPHDSQVTAEDLSISQVLKTHSRYRIVKQLGEGGMGTVYLAEHRMMDRKVALKVMNENLMRSPKALERFLREVKTAAKLDHENIVRAFDAEQAGNLHLLVMEYVEGDGLDRVVAKKGPLPVGKACEYIRQVAEGLQSAHEMQMVHRDIKPQNLILSKKGQVKILDFGLAKLRSENEVDGGLTGDNAVMGTPQYLAPEQALDAKSADIRADIYSLGCTLYFLLTGKPPFEGDSVMAYLAQHLQNTAPSLTTLRVDVPLPVAQLVERMLAKKPEQRPQTPKAVAEALLPFCEVNQANKPDSSGSLPSWIPEAENVTEEDHPIELRQTAFVQKTTSQTAVIPSDAPTTGKKPSTAKRWLLALFGVVVVATLIVILSQSAEPTNPESVVEQPSTTETEQTPTEENKGTLIDLASKKEFKKETANLIKKEVTSKVKPVVSRFAGKKKDTEGWTTTNIQSKSKEAATSWLKTGIEGNNRFLTAKDIANGKDWMWSAPAEYLGDHSDKFGKYLKFRLWADNVDRKMDTNTALVALQTNTIMLRIPLSAKELIKPNRWTDYKIRLDSSEQWRIGPAVADRGKATDEDIRRVLKNITAMLIRGDFFSGEDIGRIDDIEFGVD